MVRYLLIAAALGVVAMAVPAAAADLATIGCVRDKAPPASVEALMESARIAGRGEEEGATPKAPMADLIAAASKCKKLNGWNDDATASAALYTFVSLRLEAMRPVAESRGIHYADVTGALAAMSQAERDLLAQGDDKGIDALVRQLEKRGVDVAGSAGGGELFGRLAALTLLAEKCRNQFAAS